jgi:hypothetical protein
MLLIQDAKDSQDLGYTTIIKYITPKFSCWWEPCNSNQIEKLTNFGNFILQLVMLQLWNFRK